MIEIENLYKRYHNHHGSDWVLRDVNLIIPQGVSVGLVGRNGAGKSTLLRLIGGMDTPDRGRVVRDCRVSWPIGIGGGFQGSMTGRQNVKFVARIHGSGLEVTQIIQRVEEFAEIGDAFDEPVKTYSSGMRSRLAFGLSLAFDFDVYLSDEATAVGDRAFKAKAKQAFKDRVESASLIMVSHGESILKEMCQAGIFLDQGRATWYDNIQDAINDYHQTYDIKPDKPATKGIGKSGNKAGAKQKKPTPLGITRAEVQHLNKQVKLLEQQAENEPLEAARLASKIAQVKKRLQIHRKALQQLRQLEKPAETATTDRSSEQSQAQVPPASPATASDNASSSTQDRSS